MTKKAGKAVAISDDEKWQAENDVRSLIEARAIKSDKKRFDRAIKKAREQFDDMQKVLKEGRE